MSHENTPPLQETPFVNELRLGAGQWTLVCFIVALLVLATPSVWKRVERFEVGNDYRIPYALSKDYWLFERRLQIADPKQVVVLGDSVIWGEYVNADGTLSRFLNTLGGQSNRFINAGVNGLFPLAMEGLLKHYGSALRGRKILLHCNLLWMINPQADLQAEQEANFNHPRLVPQLFPRIPSYRADASDRVEALVTRNIRFLSWVGHVQDVYFNQKNILSWTLAEDGANPQRHPNSYKNPLSQITFKIPAEPAKDPKRGPGSRRHQPWTHTGEVLTQCEWVALDTSLQWNAFQRLVTLLRDRGNDVRVVVGPFNEHMLALQDRSTYRKPRDGVAAWLSAQRVPRLVPEALPTELYADASHPLTEGYRLLAERILGSTAFSGWR